MANINWRTINIDALDPEASVNFDMDSLRQGLVPVSAAEVQSIGAQIRQLLRGGDAEGALRGAMENAPYGGDQEAKDIHLATVVEILQSIKQGDMTPMLTRIYQSTGGPETLDNLMKYIYKGMSAAPSASSPLRTTPHTGFSQIQPRATSEGGGQAMSVLLSWHEKVVEIAGQGAIIRVMSDRRTV